MAPRVSVIIPTFNRRHVILDALESVFGQTYSDVEVIVVDDASTDGTADFLESQTFPITTRIVRLDKNGGPSAARNEGIHRASGKYIALLDSDDRWLPEKLSTQVAAAERSAAPDKTLVYSPSVLHRRNEIITRPKHAIAHAEPIADYLFCRGGYLAQCATLISTSMARAVPFRTDLRLHEDWDWYIRLEREGVRFVMVPDASCVVDDRSTDGRASRAQPAVSLAIASQWKTAISHKAHLAFVARIAPQLRGTATLRAVGLILAAYTGGAIGHWQFASLIGSLIHPELRQCAYRVRALQGRLVQPRRTTHLGGSS